MRNRDYDPEAPGWIDPHPPQRIGDITRGQWKFEPEGEAPDSVMKDCALCHCNFLSRPQWLLTRWHYPVVCIHCGDNYSHRESVIHDKRPRVIFIPNPGAKNHICPGCHETITVLAIKDGAYWLYKGPCPHCDTYFENLYYAYKAVPKKESETPTRTKNLDEID